MEHPDLSGIDPLRRAEAQRRIGILDHYLAIRSPTVADTDAHATNLGVSVAQFYKLVRAWRIHRNPNLIGVGRRMGPRSRSDGIAVEVKQIVTDVLDEIGADAAHEGIFQMVDQRCKDAGFATPSHGALWTYAMDNRATQPTRMNEAKRVLVARFWAKLPTIHVGELIFPEVVVALLLPERFILGSDVSCDPGRKARASYALARAFARLPAEASNPEVLVDAGDIDDVAAVHLARFGYEPAPSPTSISRMLSASLGRVFGGLCILQQIQRAKVESCLRARSSSALDEHSATQEIERAVAAHNARLVEINGR